MKVSDPVFDDMGCHFDVTVESPGEYGAFLAEMKRIMDGTPAPPRTGTAEAAASPQRRA